MIWWNKQIIINEEAIEEMKFEQHDHVNANTESLVTSEAFVLPNTILTFLSEIVVKDQASIFNDEEAESYSWNVGKQNVHQNVIPPALPEMGQNVLPRQLN